MKPTSIFHKLFKKPAASAWFALAGSILSVIYPEVVLQLLVYQTLSSKLVYQLMFAVVVGCFLFAVCSLLPYAVSRWVFPALIFVITLYFEVQLVYRSIFGEFMPVWQISFGTTAITNFKDAMIDGILHQLPQIGLLLLPVPAAFLMTNLWKLFSEKVSFGWCAAALLACIVFHFGAIGIMACNNTGLQSSYKVYNDEYVSSEVSIKNIGLLATAQRELKNLVFGSGGKNSSVYDTDGTAGNYSSDKYNVMQFDFETLAAGTENETLQQLDRYFASCEPTEKNEYTGMLKDYNLIMLCCEAFSPELISETRTPALYQLANNGFIFNNYYGSFKSNTTNGEYSFCTGLFPDTSRTKTIASFCASQNNYLPFCMGRYFSEKDLPAFAYHNYIGSFYSRDVTHPNMGYTFKSLGSGLDMEMSWPTSDCEMMELSCPDYLNSGSQFCAYYMTFSGHLQYTWLNPMSSKNKAVTDDLDYSDPVKAYIACNQELEYAMEYLLDALEKAGVADKTVIVMTNDHYPYGLTPDEYSELAGRTMDRPYEQFRNSFICYVPGMKIPVDTYCSTVDILPTLLNLFGFEYDSRMLAGKDILSPQAEDCAVFYNMSFLTPEYCFDAATGELTSFTGNEIDTAAAEKLQDSILRKFTISSDILNCNYYEHAFFGREQIHEVGNKYSFSDVPEKARYDALDYVITNNYLPPLSETVYGYTETCPLRDFVRIMLMMCDHWGEGSVSDEELIQRVVDAGFCTEDELSAEMLDTPVSRADVSLWLYRLVKVLGITTPQLQQPVSATVEGLDEASAEAIQWCFEQRLMVGDGSLESVLSESAKNPMQRKNLMIALYKFYVMFPH